MTTLTTTLAVSGMSCAACASRVERTLNASPDVIEAVVNLATESATIRFNEGTQTASGLAATVTAAGYPAVLKSSLSPDDVAQQRVAETDQLRRDTLIAGGLTLPVFAMEMGSHFIPGVAGLIDTVIGQQSSWALQFLLVTLVLIWPGRRFMVKGWPALLRGAPDMNSLVALGTGAAWIYSSVALFAPSLLPAGTAVVYFEAAAVIVTLILLGRWFEARAKTRTGAAIRALLSLQPRTATIKRSGAWEEIPSEHLEVGDVIRLYPGAQLPTDGTVLSGESWVDESMITGEPTPVLKSGNDPLTGGTINGAGTLEFRATAVGDQTVLASILRMVEQAQAAKLPIQAAVDKVIAVFVPVVLAIAALTVLLWLVVVPNAAASLALVAGVSVLIVACPCAMGLATPTSIMVATGRAAELGILFRKGDVLQSLSGATVVAFDKTGTLTAGQPTVTDVVLVDETARGDVMQKVAAVEALSEHPLAKAIVNDASLGDMRRPEVENFMSHTGRGVSGTVGGSAVVIGNAALMAEHGVGVAPLEAQAADLSGNGATPVFVAIEGRLVALLGISDRIKPDSHDAIQALHAMGLRTAMLTGDASKTANVVGTELGITSIFADLLPGEKAAALKEVASPSDVVVFVGDGINDAPALSSADIGIAVGTGTDVAMETADIVLMSGTLSSVAQAIRVSRATMRNIRQNLFWAFAYNVALIPVAAGILYPMNGTLLSPMLAAAAMALSSLFVLSNALRLRSLSAGARA